MLDIVTADGFLREVEANGVYLRSLLEGEVRGLGLMVGIELGERARPYVDRLAEKGILALTAGKKVLRLLPPLVMAREDIERVAETVRGVLADQAVARSGPVR